MKRLKQYQYERYAILCQLAYKDAHAHYTSVLEPFSQLQFIDTQGRLSARVLWMKDKKEVIVVFRGSVGVRDWLCNLCYIPSKMKALKTQYSVHWGFKRLLEQQIKIHEYVYDISANKLIESAASKDTLLYMSMRQGLFQVLEPLLSANKRVSFIGHSSGGAMAIMIADLFERTFPKCVKRVVTFGQPAFAGRSFKRQYLLDKKTYRICCDLDIVTFMPPIPYYFWHVGKMLWLHDDKIYENTPTHTRLIMSLRSWILRPITYHYMKKYIRNKSLFDEH